MAQKWQNWCFKSFEIQESELRIINDVYGIVGGI